MLHYDIFGGRILQPVWSPPARDPKSNIRLPAPTQMLRNSFWSRVVVFAQGWLVFGLEVSPNVPVSVVKIVPWSNEEQQQNMSRKSKQ
jgi:hypothetical protein